MQKYMLYKKVVLTHYEKYAPELVAWEDIEYEYENGPFDTLEETKKELVNLGSGYFDDDEDGEWHEEITYHYCTVEEFEKLKNKHG